MLTLASCSKLFWFDRNNRTRPTMKGRIAAAKSQIKRYLFNGHRVKFLLANNNKWVEIEWQRQCENHQEVGTTNPVTPDRVHDDNIRVIYQKSDASFAVVLVTSAVEEEGSQQLWCKLTSIITQQTQLCT